MKIILILFLFIQSVHTDPLLDSYILEGEGKYNKAYEVLEPVIQNSSKDYIIQLRAGWIQYLLGNYSQSVIFFQKASVIESSAIEPRIFQLKPLFALGKYREIELVSKSILKLDQKNYTGRSSLAFAFYTLGDYKNAIVYYESLIKDYPTDTEMLLGLGWSYMGQMEKQKANSIFKIVERILPYDERVRMGLKSSQ
jgi:tetratricopeptide (TPR) repeat protein